MSNVVDQYTRLKIDPIQPIYDTMRSMNLFITNFRIYRDHVLYTITDNVNDDRGEDFYRAINLLEWSGDCCISVKLSKPGSFE